MINSFIKVVKSKSLKIDLIGEVKELEIEREYQTLKGNRYVEKVMQTKEEE